MTSVLDVKDVHTGYGQQEVVRGLSFHVEAGEALGLIGPNGHGKTTLMRVLSGLQPVWSGEVRLFGRSITGARPRKIVEAGLVHVPQETRLFPDLSVRETLQLGAYLSGARGAAARMETVFGIFPKLRERRKQLCRTLSGGERQMTAIGVGLMAGPKVLLLDEPTLGLAPRIRLELRERIAEVRSTGVTLVIVDGDLDFLLATVDRWCAVDTGRIVLESEPGIAMDRETIVNLYFSGNDQATQ